MNRNVRIASTAYRVPDSVAAAEFILCLEAERVRKALANLNQEKREKILGGLGIQQVHVCDGTSAHELARGAALKALDGAGLDPRTIDLIVDFSTTLPPPVLAHWLAGEFKADQALCLSFRGGGCGDLHLALKTAASFMVSDDRLSNALLVAADTPPQGSRSLLPVSIQGDAASALVLVRSPEGPRLVDIGVRTLGYLHDVITVGSRCAACQEASIEVDSVKAEEELMPVYFWNFQDLLQNVLGRNGLCLSDIDHFIYSNISRSDQDSFVRALGLPVHNVFTSNLENLGHAFASDLVINYTDLSHQSKIRSGQWLLFASAGAGFTWGVTLVQA